MVPWVRLYGYNVILMIFGFFGHNLLRNRVFYTGRITMTTFFNSVELAPPVEVFALVAAFNEDNHAQKVNLSIGGNSCSQYFMDLWNHVYSVAIVMNGHKN